MPSLTELTGISIHWQPYHADESCFLLGENGHAELTAEGLGDALLALFDKLGRGLDDACLRDFVDDVLAEAGERAVSTKRFLTPTFLSSRSRHAGAGGVRASASWPCSSSRCSTNADTAWRCWLL
jgi:hypothetical protein